MALLDGVSAKLTTDNLKEMVVKVVNDKQAPDVVAKEFVAKL
jgi:glycine betaine/choline ABC-type transport system substrate-binding protein